MTLAQRTLQGNVASVYKEAQTAQAQVDSLRSSSDLSAESLRLTLLRYQAGQPSRLGQGLDERLRVPTLLVAFTPVGVRKPPAELAQRRADVLVLVDLLQRVHVVSSMVLDSALPPPPMGPPDPRRRAISSSP